MSSVEKLEVRSQSGIKGLQSTESAHPIKKSTKLRGSLSIAVFFLTTAAGYGLMFLILEHLLQG